MIPEIIIRLEYDVTIRVIRIFFQKAAADVIAVGQVAIPKFDFESRKFKTKKYRIGKFEIFMMTHI